MKILVFIRQPINWQLATLNNIPDRIRKIVSLWNVDMPYFQFREEMKNISVQNWDKFSNYVFTCSIEDLLQRFGDFDENDYIIPTGDDLWHSPELSNFLLQQTSDVVGWDAYEFATVTPDKPGTNWSKRITPFAIRIKTLKTMESKIVDGLLGRKKSVQDYPSVQDYVASMGLNYLVSKECYSCYNLHPGDFAILPHKLNILPALFDQWKSWPKRPWRPKTAAWLDPYIVATMDVYKKTTIKMM